MPVPRPALGQFDTAPASGPSRPAPRWQAAMVTLATIALTVGLGGCAVPTMPWQLKSGPLTPDQVLTVAKPAMVLVQVDYTASFSLPKLTITDTKYQVVRDKLQAEFEAGPADF